MNVRLSRLTTAMATAAALMAAAAGAATSSGPGFEADGDGFFENWIRDRLSVGLAFSMFRLSDGDRPANRDEDFLGNVNELDDSHANRLAPVIEYQALDYLCIGLTYMQVEARTLNFNNGQGDGTAILKGPVITADLTYPFWERRIWPHVGSGVAFLSGDFEEYTWWHLGYSSPSAWEYYGSPTDKLRAGHYRDIEVDDQTKAFFTVGVSFRPYPRVKLDVSYRQISLDPDCNFAYSYPGRGRAIRNYGDFDMSGRFWLFSVSYIF